MKIRLSILVVIAAFHVNAQPVINSSIYPMEGTEAVMISCDTTGVVAGAGGAMMNWDFSGLVVEDTFDVFKYTSVDSSIHKDSFPGADLRMVRKGNEHFFRKQSATMRYLGTAGGATVIPYQNSENLLQWPFTYLDEINDSFRSDFFFGGMATSWRQGAVLIKADGYGSLKLPHGDYYGVLRIHTTEEYTDTVYIASSVINVISYLKHTWAWYQPGKPHPILTIEDLVRTSSSGNTYEYNVFYHADAIPSSLELIPEKKIAVYPNPSSGYLIVRVDEPGSGFEAQLVDMMGKVVYSGNLDQGTNRIGTTDYVPGVYQLNINGPFWSENRTIIVQ